MNRVKKFMMLGLAIVAISSFASTAQAQIQFGNGFNSYGSYRGVGFGTTLNVGGGFGNFTTFNRGYRGYYGPSYNFRSYSPARRYNNAYYQNLVAIKRAKLLKQKYGVK